MHLSAHLPDFIFFFYHLYFLPSLLSFLLYISRSMFSRVASTVARAPARVAARRFTSRAAAAVSAQGSSSSSTFAAAAAGACAVAGLALAVQPDSALCAAPAFKYTGEPGTVHERSFIVSFLAGRVVVGWRSGLVKRLICSVSRNKM